MTSCASLSAKSQPRSVTAQHFNTFAKAAKTVHASRPEETRLQIKANLCLAHRKSKRAARGSKRTRKKQANSPTEVFHIYGHVRAGKISHNCMTKVCTRTISVDFSWPLPAPLPNICVCGSLTVGWIRSARTNTLAGCAIERPSCIFARLRWAAKADKGKSKALQLPA